MPGFPAPRALLADWRAMRASMRARHLPLRLPERAPEVEACWEKLHIGTGPVPEIARASATLESGAAGEIACFAFPSRVTTPFPENNRVVGRLYTPHMPAQNEPLLLLLHVNGRQDWA